MASTANKDFESGSNRFQGNSQHNRALNIKTPCINTQARTICPGGYLAKNRILFFLTKRALEKWNVIVFMLSCVNISLFWRFVKKLSGLGRKILSQYQRHSVFDFRYDQNVSPTPLCFCVRGRNLQIVYAPTSFVHLGMASEIQIKQSFVDIDSRKESMNERE